MTLTTDFDGPILPTGWDFDDPTGAGSLVLGESRVHISIPAGVSTPSVSSPSNLDHSVGVVHGLTTADLDVAVQCDSDVTNYPDLRFSVFAFGPESEVTRFTFYSTPSSPVPRVFGYQRNGTANGSSGNQNITSLGTALWPWMRVTYESATGRWTCHGSTDGQSWTQIQSRVCAFQPVRLKVAATNEGKAPGGTLRINRVVDFLGQEGTDARTPVGAYDRVSLIAFSGTDAALPTELVDDSGNGGSLTLTGTVLRLTTNMDIDGSRARLRYVGAPYAQCGTLALIEHAPGSSLAYNVVGLVDDSGDPSNQYIDGTAYGWETTGTTSRRVVRFDPMGAYSEHSAMDTRLSQTSGPSLRSKLVWVRTERADRRLRIREWLANQPEPESWHYDGQEQVHDGPWGPHLGYAHSDATSGGLVSCDVHRFEFYRITNGNAPPPEQLPIAAVTGWTSIGGAAVDVLADDDDATVLHSSENPDSDPVIPSLPPMRPPEADLILAYRPYTIGGSVTLAPAISPDGATWTEAPPITISGPPRDVDIVLPANMLTEITAAQWAMGALVRLSATTSTE